jgi:hypothetical protein
MVDTQLQRLAFFAFFFAIVLGSLLVPLLAEKFGQQFQNRSLMKSILGMLVIIVIVAAVVQYLPLPVLAAAIILASVTTLARHRHGIKIVWASTAILIAFAIAVGFLVTPVWSLVSKFFWPGPDLHYAGVFSSGERLAAGRLLFVDNYPAYGVIIPILIGLFSKFSHAPSFSELMRLVQAAQSLCLVALIYAAWLCTRVSPAAGRAVAMFFVTLNIVPWLGNLGPAIWFPNQSGIRFFMLMVGVLVACLLKDARSRETGAIVGATAAVAILYNPETGIAVTAGLGIAWLMRVRSETLSLAATSAIIGLAVMGSVFGVVAAVYQISFGAPLIPSFDSATAVLRLYSGGYGGIKLSFDPLALLILVHAAYVFVLAIRYLLDPRSQRPDFPSAAIATMLLVFYPYYVTRPHTWNFWSYTALYSVLLAPVIASNGRRFIPLIIAACVVLPPSLIFFRDSFFMIGPFIKTPDMLRFILDREKGCADGLVLPKDLCQHLAERAATLKRMANDGVVISLTQVPMLTMRMSGVHGFLPTIDVFNLAPTPATFDDLLQKIQRLNPRTILVDDPHDRILKFPQAVYEFNMRLIRALGPNYCRAGIVGGWEVVERSDRCAQDSRRS